MRKLNKEKRPSGQVVKANKKAIVISTLLALVGVTVAVVFYQYTYSAKLEQELNNKQYQLEERIKEVEAQKQQIINQDSEKSKLEQERQNLEQQKQELEKQLQAKAEKARVASIQAAQAQSAPKVVKSTAPAQTTSVAAVSGSKYDWLRQAGVPQSEWQCADALITKESGWRVNAQNPSSSAYGIPQSLPGNKMASAGADWQTNPVTQLRWMNSYVNARYGGFCQAWSHSQSVNWY